MRDNGGGGGGCLRKASTAPLSDAAVAVAAAVYLWIVDVLACMWVIRAETREARLHQPSGSSLHQVRCHQSPAGCALRRTLAEACCTIAGSMEGDIPMCSVVVDRCRDLE